MLLVLPAGLFCAWFNIVPITIWCNREWWFIIVLGIPSNGENPECVGDWQREMVAIGLWERECCCCTCEGDWPHEPVVVYEVPRDPKGLFGMPYPPPTLLKCGLTMPKSLNCIVFLSDI